MAHPRPRSSPATPPPRFALIMRESAIVKHKQMIPLKSSMIFGEELSEFATLTTPNGKAWKVRLNKLSKENIWLCDGLKEFIDYYKTHYASIVHFAYQGSSSFRVCIFDAMGSEIDYPHSDDTSDEESIQILDTSDDESSEVLETKPPISHDSSKSKASNGHMEQQQALGKRQSCTSPQKRGDRPPKRSRPTGRQTQTRSSARIKDEADLKELAGNVNDVVRRGKPKSDDAAMIVPKGFSSPKSRRLVVSKETKEAVRVATRKKLKNPSFMAICRPYNHVDVPAEFVSRHLSLCSEDIQLQVHGGKRKWSVRCFYYDRNISSMRIGKGWPLFSTNNNLKVGDVCVFELIENGKNILLRVWIYSAADYAGPVQKRSE